MEKRKKKDFKTKVNREKRRKLKKITVQYYFTRSLYRLLNTFKKFLQVYKDLHKSVK